MKIQLINKELLKQLHFEALANGRRRMNFDLRTTPEDNSQRMLNVLEVGTLKVRMGRMGNKKEPASGDEALIKERGMSVTGGR